MDISAYVDGITDLLRKAGVTQKELDEANAAQSITHCFMKGVPFEKAAEAMCRKFDIEITD